MSSRAFCQWFYFLFKFPQLRAVLIFSERGYCSEINKHLFVDPFILFCYYEIVFLSFIFKSIKIPFTQEFSWCCYLRKKKISFPSLLSLQPRKHTAFFWSKLEVFVDKVDPTIVQRERNNLSPGLGVEVLFLPSELGRYQGVP